MHVPIAYTYMADHDCPDWQHFDGEVETLACGTCGVVIETYEPEGI